MRILLFPANNSKEEFLQHMIELVNSTGNTVVRWSGSLSVNDYDMTVYIPGQQNAEAMHILSILGNGRHQATELSRIFLFGKGLFNRSKADSKPKFILLAAAAYGGKVDEVLFLPFSGDAVKMYHEDDTACEYGILKCSPHGRDIISFKEMCTRAGYKADDAGHTTLGTPLPSTMQVDVPSQAEQSLHLLLLKTL